MSSNRKFWAINLWSRNIKRGPQAPAAARAQSPTRNTRIKRRKFRKDFVGYFDVPESEVYTSEFTVRAQIILLTLFTKCCVVLV